MQGYERLPAPISVPRPSTAAALLNGVVAEERQFAERGLLWRRPNAGQAVAVSVERGNTCRGLGVDSQVGDRYECPLCALSRGTCAHRLTVRQCWGTEQDRNSRQDEQIAKPQHYASLLEIVE